MQEPREQRWNPAWCGQAAQGLEICPQSQKSRRDLAGKHRGQMAAGAWRRQAGWQHTSEKT